MMKHNLFGAITVLAALIGAGMASASPALLNFEGMSDLALINDYYNGGTDSTGASGSSQGISFKRGMALDHANTDGSLRYNNEPSPDTVMTSRDASLIMNVSGGFTSTFSFYFSAFQEGRVNLFSELDGAGSLVLEFNLGAQYAEGCTPTGGASACNWTFASLSFLGTAKSAVFDTLDGQFLYDDVAMADVGAAVVPEPAALVLVSLALGAAALSTRRRKDYSNRGREAPLRPCLS